MKIKFIFLLLFLSSINDSLSQENILLRVTNSGFCSEYEFPNMDGELINRVIIYRKSILKTNLKIQGLHQLRKLPRKDRKTKYQYVHFAFSDEDLRTKNFTILPGVLNSNLIKYIKKPKRNYYFDCNAFAHYLHGIDYDRNIPFDPSLWKIDSRLENHSNLELKIKTGDTIAIAYQSEKNHNTIYEVYPNFTHVAIYLAHGFFISKLGNTGPIIITTLEEMKNGFGGEDVYIISPR